MKVLLLHDIKGLGQKMEVKEVSDGYARNFLLPRKLAVPTTQEALKKKEQWEEGEVQLLAELERTVKQLGEVVLEFSVTTGENGQVFGSVKANDIKLALKDKGFQNFEIKLEKPLKHLGEHTAEVHMSHGIKGKVKVIVKALS